MSLGVFDVVYINPPYKRDTFLKKEAPTMGQGTSGHSYIYHNGTKYLVTQTTNHSISTTDLPSIFAFSSKSEKSENESSKVDSLYHSQK